MILHHLSGSYFKKLNVIYLTPDKIKKITRGGSAIFFICFAAFAIIDSAIRPSVVNDWAEPLVQSLLFLIAGIVFVTLSSITGIAAWKMTEDEFYEMLVSQSFLEADGVYLGYQKLIGIGKTAF